MSPQYSQLKGGVTSAMREGSHGWDIVFKINVLSSRGVFAGSTTNGQETQNCLLDSRGLLANETKRQSR